MFIRSVFDKKHLNHKIIILLFLILSLCFDFIDKIEIFYGIDFIKYNRALKVVFLSYAVVFSVVNIRFILKHTKFIVFLFLILCAIFLFKGEYNNLYLMEFLRYAFIFIAFPLLFHTFFIEKKDIVTPLYSLLKYVIVANAIIIVTGILFNIQVFKTYDSIRFGYNGFILSQGFTPYLYLSATVFFWVFRDRKMLLLTIVLSFISGVKGAYLAEFLVLSLLVLCSKEFSKTFKIKAFITIAFIFITTLTILMSIPPFSGLMQSDKLLSEVFSFRIHNLMYVIQELTSENFNIFTGVHDFDTLRLELQLVDVILFFGIIGLAVFSYVVYRLYNYIKKSNVATIFIATSILLSILIGNLFYVPMASLLFLIVSFSLEQKLLFDSQK